MSSLPTLIGALQKALLKVVGMLPQLPMALLLEIVLPLLPPKALVAGSKRRKRITTSLLMNTLPRRLRWT
jgi:hypothetical protein